MPKLAQTLVIPAQAGIHLSLWHITFLEDRFPHTVHHPIGIIQAMNESFPGRRQLILGVIAPTILKLLE